MWWNSKLWGVWDHWQHKPLPGAGTAQQQCLQCRGQCLYQLDVLQPLSAVPWVPEAAMLDLAPYPHHPLSLCCAQLAPSATFPALAPHPQLGPGFGDPAPHQVISSGWRVPGL